MPAFPADSSTTPSPDVTASIDSAADAASAATRAGADRWPVASQKSRAAPADGGSAMNGSAASSANGITSPLVSRGAHGSATQPSPVLRTFHAKPPSGGNGSQATATSVSPLARPVAGSAQDTWRNASVQPGSSSPMTAVRSE